jgi:hypothetical protein
MVNLEDLYRILKTGHVQSQGVVDTVPVPLLVLDGALCIQSATAPFSVPSKSSATTRLGSVFTTLVMASGIFPNCVVCSPT